MVFSYRGRGKEGEEGRESQSIHKNTTPPSLSITHTREVTTTVCVFIIAIPGPNIVNCPLPPSAKKNLSLGAEEPRTSVRTKGTTREREREKERQLGVKHNTMWM